MFDIKPFKSELATLCDFVEIYEQFRLVDPATSNVYMLKDGKAILSVDEFCYKTWNRDSPCDNCISSRTCLDNKQYMKLEYLDGQVFMIVAKPVIIDTQQFSLELVTDVTNSMVVQDEFHRDHNKIGIAELIEKVNLLSISDVFTGLFNNAYIKNKISELTHDLKASPFTILIIDIDKFKHVNDVYGHLAGDNVILTIAAMLKEFSLHSGYTVGRMGGDEYCMVLENCEILEGERHAKYITQEISNIQFVSQGKKFNVEVSIGVGEYTYGEEIFSFIERVDKALYAIKHQKGTVR